MMADLFREMKTNFFRYNNKNYVIPIKPAKSLVLWDVFQGNKSIV